MATAQCQGDVSNPLDLIEDILSENEWMFDRRDDNDLCVECSKVKTMGSYQLAFTWDVDLSAMHFSCFTDLKVCVEQRAPVYELLALCNGRMWLGHFDLASGDDSPTFRHTLLLSGRQQASVEELEDMVDIALAECERFHTAFYFVVHGGRDPSDAIAAGLIDTVGEA